jgi:N-6 DNA Methylase
VSGVVDNSTSDELVSASEIAEMAHVTPSAVSNWRKRFPDFPAPAGTGSTGGDLFERADVETWLEQRGLPKRGHQPAQQRSPEASAQTPKRRGDLSGQLWAVAERLRGQALAGDLVSAVAAGAALIHLARRRQLPAIHRFSQDELSAWVLTTRIQLEGEHPELHRLFTPLARIDERALRLLLDSLADAASVGELATAFDYVLGRGLRYGEYRTPTPVAMLLAELAEPHRVVFDPALGSAEFLIQAAQIAQGRVELCGQEINESSWRIALARLLLRDLDARVEFGDSLASDRFVGLRADVVMCEPPAGHRTADLRGDAGDPRWQLLGSFDAPPARASDFIWLAHVIYHLAADGRGYVLLPRASLFRKGADARFRAELLRQGTVEAIVTLPAGSLAGTAIPPVLWIVRPPTRIPDAVLVVDASGASGITSKLQARLARTLTRWRHAPSEFKPAAGFATNVPVLELLAGDAVLTPSRWLYEPELVDPDQLIARVDHAQHSLQQARTHLEPHPARTKFVPADQPPARIRVGELVDSGAATLLRPARVKTEQFGDEGLPVWLPADVREPWRREEEPRFVDPALVDPRSITEPGDIVFTTIGGLRTRVDEEGGHVLGTSLQALRLNPKLFDAYVVAALLTSEPNRRLLTGTTIPRVDVLELEIPRLDAATTDRAARLLRALESELAWSHTVVAHTEDLRAAIVDALATGAARIGGHAEDTGDDQ